MTEHPGARPEKQRELENHHFDSTIWNDFVFRDDDIVIATYAKSGTTWVQQIVAQLINQGVNGRWADVLSAHDVAAYEQRAIQELGAECAHWLATGRHRDAG